MKNGTILSREILNSRGAFEIGEGEIPVHAHAEPQVGSRLAVTGDGSPWL